MKLASGASSFRQRVFKGLSANALSQVQNTVAQLLLVPIFLSYWGAARYGEWLLLSAIPTAIVLADFGVGTAVANELVVRVAKQRMQEARDLFRGMLAFFFAVALGVFFVAFGLISSGLIDGLLKTPPEHVQQIHQASYCLVVYALLLIGTAVLVAPLNSMHRYALGMNLGTTLRTAEMLVTIVAIVLSRSLLVLSMALLLTRLMGLFVAGRIVYKIVPWLPLRPRFGAAFENRSIMISGLAFVSFSLVNALMNQGVLIAIGIKLDTAAVANFAIIRSLTRIVAQFMNVIIQALQPEVTHAYARADLEQVRRICLRTFQSTFWLGMVSCLGIIALGPWFLGIWTKKIVALDTLLLWELALAQLVATIWMASASAVAATNRHQRTGGWFLATSIVTVLLSSWASATGGLRLVAGLLVLSEAVKGVFVIREACSMMGEKIGVYLLAPFGKLLR